MPKMKLEQWGWSNMEELLQCPVCLEPPYTGIVVQCRSGHHICSTCKLQLDECPLCKCSFGGTRNFVVEEIMRNYLVLKNTMLLTSITGEEEGEINKKVKIPKPVVPKKEKICYSLTIDKGLFPCRVENCDAKLPVCRLLNHIRTFHSDVLNEAKMTSTGNYSNNWQFQYTTSKPITRMCKVVFVSGIGLIFVNIEILRSGHVIAACQMGAKLPTCKNYTVTVNIFNENLCFSHVTPLYSSRETMINLLFKNACLLLKRNSISSVLVDKRFICSIDIRKVAPNDNITVTSPNMNLIKAVHAQRLFKLAEEKRLLESSNRTKVNNNKGGRNSKSVQNGRTVLDVQPINGASSSTVVVPLQTNVQTTVRRRKGRR